MCLEGVVAILKSVEMFAYFPSLVLKILKTQFQLYCLIARDATQVTAR
jgi:hypothetical protein